MPEQQPENLLQRFVRRQMENATLESVLSYLGIRDFQYRVMKNWCDDALPHGLVVKIEATKGAIPYYGDAFENQNELMS